MKSLQEIHDTMTLAVGSVAVRLSESTKADVIRVLDAVETELTGISPMTAAFVLALALQRLVGDEIARRGQ